jgi:branched-chain amino acid transport system substrate-binding protein
MNKKIVLGFASVLILALVGVGIFRYVTQNKAEKEVVKIGAILPLTGPISDYGSNVLSGQQKAINLLNLSNSNYHFELVVEDGKSGNKDAVNAYNKLKNQGVKYYTAVSSNIAIPILDMVVRDSVLIFPGSSHPLINNPIKTFVFRHFVTAKQEAELIINKISETEINETIGLVVNDDFGNGFISEIKKIIRNNNTDSLKSIVFFDKKERAIDNYIALILKEKPKNLILVGYKDFPGNIVKRVKELNLNISIYCSYSFVLTKADIVAGEKAMEGVHLVDIDVSEELLNKYNIKLHEAIDYSVILILGEAIIKSNNNGQMSVAKYLESLTEIDCGIYKCKQTSHDFYPPVKLVTR